LPHSRADEPDVGIPVLAREGDIDLHQAAAAFPGSARRKLIGARLGFTRLRRPPSAAQGFRDQSPRRRLCPGIARGERQSLAREILGLYEVPLRLSHLAELDPEQWIVGLDSQGALDRTRSDSIIAR